MSAEESRSSRSEAPQSGDLHGDAAAGSCPSERRADSRPQDAAAGSAAADTHGAVQADGNGSDSGPAGTDGTDGTDGTVVPPDSAQAADATASSAGDAAGPGNGGGKDGGALAGSAQAGSVSGEGPVPRCGFCACCVPRTRQRLKRAAAEKDRTQRQQQQHRAARPELSGKAALFAQNGRPHG